MTEAELDRVVTKIAQALTRNKYLVIVPSVKPESVQLHHRDGEAGTFSVTEVARVLAEGGDLEAYFVRNF
jgi:hypothetical protein